MFCAKFTASFATFAELQYDEKTRTFLAVEVGAGHLEVRNGISVDDINQTDLIQ